MLARQFSLPTITPLAPTLAKPFHRLGWVWEEKLDGWRIVAYKSGRDVRLVSRTGRDHAKRFQKLTRRGREAAGADADP